MTKTIRPTVTALALYSIAVSASAALIIASLVHRVPMDITEVLGFVTGGWAVWLTVKQNIWNWPIGIANSAFYVVLFFQARLYADTSLQFVYIVLGFLGWYWWLRGGERHTRLDVARTGPTTAVLLGVVAAAGTIGLAIFLARVHDSAPFLDALTTVLSLVAQYMLTRKLLENWLVWMTADVVYVGLYASRHLYLTSVLYAVFFSMCVAGLLQWRDSLRTGGNAAIDAGSTAVAV